MTNPTNAPRTRRINALNGPDSGDTSVFWRALDEADALVDAREQHDRLQARVDELEAHNAELAQRWRKRAESMKEGGDGAAQLVAYHLQFAADELEARHD